MADTHLYKSLSVKTQAHTIIDSLSIRLTGKYGKRCTLTDAVLYAAQAAREKLDAEENGTPDNPRTEDKTNAR